MIREDRPALEIEEIGIWKSARRGHHAPCSDAVIRDSLKQARDASNKAIEYGRYRRSLENRSVTEGYLAGDMYLCLRIERGYSSIGFKFGDWYALIETSAAGDYNSCPTEFEVTDPGYLPSVGSWNEFDMFVDIGERKDGVEVVVPSKVRLFSKDQFDQVGIEPLYFPLLPLDPDGAGRSFAVPWTALAPRVKDQLSWALPAWEIHFGEVSFANTRHDRKPDSDLIQAGSEVIDYLRRQHMDHLRWRVGQIVSHAVV